MEEIQAFQARLHALHARIRTMFVLAARAIAQSEEAFGRELRAASGRMTVAERLAARQKYMEIRDRISAAVPIMPIVADIQQLIYLTRIFTQTEWEEADRKLMHLRKIMLLLIVLFLYRILLLHQLIILKELKQLRDSLPD